MFKKHISSEISILKIIALISMTIDHIGFIMFSDIEMFRIIGRLSFPMFGYILIHNYLYFTKSKQELILRLFLFAIVSQPFFMYGTGLIKVNIFGTFSIFLLAVYFIEKILYTNNGYARYIKSIIIFFLVLFLSKYFDYGYKGVIFLSFIYLAFRNNFYILGIIVTIFIQYITNYKEMLAAMSFLYLINIIEYIENNFGRYFYWVKKHKYFFYLYYPLHILLIKLVKVYI